MKSFSWSLGVSAGVCLALALSGCGAGVNFPETGSITQSALGTITGNNYGGHAPLVNAHVFVLQVGTGGYGAKVSSLIVGGGSSQYPTATDVMPGSPTLGMSYVTTDGHGEFNITGDYTCTAGLPVYLYASGGNPSAPGVGTPIAITGATSSTTTPGYAGLLVVTFSTTGTQLLYQGESIVFGTFSDPNYGAFSGTTQTVASVNLTTGKFSVVLGPASGPQGPSTFTTTVTQASAPNNPAAVNLAVLGLCPSTGSQNFSNLKYVYMNEVSTAAAAYALAPFAAVTTANNDALHIGTSATNLVGLQNAALTAGYLYDIQGGNIGTANNGDGHIARSVTPNAAAGVVPQLMLDTIGNILANCIDSANTYSAATAPTGTASAQCTGSAPSGLFYNARNDGTLTGTPPNDTATAAINIAHYPGGAASNSSFAANLFNGVTGNVPFAPSLSRAPHDFLVGITYATPATTGAVSDVETDAQGNVWTMAPTANTVYELTPAGTYNAYTPPVGTVLSTGFLTGLAIDTSGTVYAPALVGTIKFTPGTATGTLIGTVSANANQMVADDLGNLYIANSIPAAQTLSYVAKESTAGVLGGPPFPLTGPCEYEVQYVMLDASNNVWTNNQFEGSTANFICEYNSAGTLVYQLAIPGVAFPLSYGIEIDAGGNAWFPEKDNSKLFKIAAGTTGSYTPTPFTSTCPAGAGCTIATGGTLATPFGVAVDGANDVWTSNSGTALGGTTYSSIVPFSNAAAALTPTYLIGTGYGQNLLFLQTDISGNLWAASYAGNQIVNFVGVSTPTVQPLSLARHTNKLGATP